MTHTVPNSSRFYPGIITLLLTLPTVRNLNGSGKEMGDEQSSLITAVIEQVRVADFKFLN